MTLTLTKKRVRQDVKKYFHIIRVVHEGNKLSGETECCNSLTSMMVKLIRWDPTSVELPPCTVPVGNYTYAEIYTKGTTRVKDIWMKRIQVTHVQIHTYKHIGMRPIRRYNSIHVC